ncbi:MAG: hypothetical protein EBE86_030790 [Hormoscilla sp. GUM202]|nr:hypothetical protein [Hormoscilla sp. GUM202]
MDKKLEGSVGWVDGRKPNTPTVRNSHCIEETKHSSYEMLLAQYRDRPRIRAIGAELALLCRAYRSGKIGVELLPILMIEKI